MEGHTYLFYKQYLFVILSAVLFAGLCVGCKKTVEKGESTEQEQVADTTREKQESSIKTVELKVLKLQPFQEELLANGKLEAHQKSTLKFRVRGTIRKLYVKNGDAVGKGEILVELDPFEYRQILSNEKIGYTKAQLELEDMLVGRGYDLAHRDSIPNNIYEMATIRSGYAEAQNRLKKARADYDATRLRAPFYGKVANLSYKAFDRVPAGSPVLTLIDDRIFEVSFTLIESEIEKVSLGERIEVSAFEGEEDHLGKITSINPVVGDNGMVRVRACIDNNGELMEGMNVKVRIQKELPNQLIVPKSAIVLRQNKEVLFKYVNGKAFWTYVRTTHENSTSYVVIPDPDKPEASLEPGDSIVVSGNLNLAHESELEIKTVH